MVGNGVSKIYLTCTFERLYPDKDLEDIPFDQLLFLLLSSKFNISYNELNQCTFNWGSFGWRNVEIYILEVYYVYFTTHTHNQSF